MKNINFAVILFLFFSGLTYAQEDIIFRHPLRAQTEETFLAVCQRISQHPFMRGNFEQERLLSRLDRTLRSSGSFLIAANMGMVWDTINPFPSTLVLGGDFLMQSRSGGQKTVISAQGNEAFLRMAEVISTVFSGNARALVDNFKVYFVGSTAFWELGLIPQDRAINAFAERIIMRGDTVIRSIQVFEQSGDSIKYILLNHNFPTGLNADEQAHFRID